MESNVSDIPLPSDVKEPTNGVEGVPAESDFDSQINEFLVVDIGNESSAEEQIKVDDEEGQYVSPIKTNHRKRKREEHEETKDILTGVYVRVVYPLNKIMDKTVTVGVFRSQNFTPGVLINHCGKSSLLFTIDLWNILIQYSVVIETYLFNRLTGKKTKLGFEKSDIEVDNIRIKGIQYVRLRDVTKHLSKILLSPEEFHNLAALAPVVARYLDQLVTYGPVLTHYLSATVQQEPDVRLSCGPIDPSFYNRLPHEVQAFRSIEQKLKKAPIKSTESKPTGTVSE